MPPGLDHQHRQLHDGTKFGEERHLSQCHLELIALTKLFRSTGGRSLAEDESATTWKRQTGWDEVLTVAAALQNGQTPLSKTTTMQTQFPSVFGVKWERNHVVAVDLSANGLAGKLPIEITQLRFLTTLKLRNNPELRGSLPSQMASSLPHLRYCYLDGARLENVLPFESAHSFQITQVRAAAGGKAISTVRFCTGDDNSRNLVRWMADMTETEMLKVHATLKKLHATSDPQDDRRKIRCTAHNATGPERAAAATKLQRIYRARIERTRFRTFLHSLVEMKVDPTTGYSYYVNARTGETTWERPAFLGSSNDFIPESAGGTNTAGNNLRDASEAWQPYDDGNGNTYYWNSSSGESTWEPPAFLSRIYEELRMRYGADKTDEERFELFFQDVDRDGTGEIDQDEFARLCGDLGMAMSAKQIGEVFRELDTSGDGQLNRQELIAWLTRNYT
ncbi:hypothetical protein BBJ28_00004288 [Nothophytophthora sp. Chile5]|nr:hypothetical protein BBJ28_00004288 [Nothophytophthora sp. Chile5]